jgi:Domain of unknown function (DUF3576)
MNMYNHTSKIGFFALLCVCLLSVSGCGSTKGEAKYPSGLDRTQTGDDIYGERQSILGPEGLQIFGGKRNDPAADSGIGVNSFLWRASLDTISFMPMASADPFGGVIITDWYSAEENSNERVKLNIFILGRELKADGISVKTFRQEKGKNGDWKDAPVADETNRALEDTILTRARQLRISGLSAEKK